MYEGLYDTRKGLAPDDGDLIGAMTARLILPWDKWVHRRVEHMSFVDESVMRRNVSIDFTLPFWFHELRRTPKDSGKRQLVPLGFARKGVLVNFSLRDELDKSLPLLTAAQNAQVARLVLLSLAKSALDQDVPIQIQHDIHSLVSQPAGKGARAAYLRLLNSHDPAWSARGRLSANSTFSNLAALFQHHFLILSMVNIGVSDRRVLHMSYEESFWDRAISLSQWSRMWGLAKGDSRVIYIDVPSASEADSYHLEIEAPEGVMITKRESYFYRGTGTSIEREVASGSYRRAHFHFAYVTPRSKASIVAHLRPRSSTRIRAATLMNLLVVLATTLITVRLSHLEHGDDEVATTLLLAAIGVLGLIVAREGENELAAALLLPLRVLSISPVVLAVLAAMVVVVRPPEPYGRGFLAVIALAMLVSLSLLGRNWYVVRRAVRKYQQRTERSEG